MMKMNRKIKLLVITAMFAAMTTALTFVHIPVGNGIVHVGDSVIYLAACVLPFPYAIFAGAVGGAAADYLTGYVIWILPTLVIKALITLPFSPKSDKILTKRNALMVIPAGLITVVGYCVAGAILFDLPGAILNLFGGAVQATGSAALFLAFAAGLDKLGFKRRVG